MPPGRSRRRKLKAVIDLWVDRFTRHNLLTWASAIALRALVALVPLTLLGLALLGSLGLERVWKRHLAPPLERHLTHPTYHAINSTVDKIFHAGTTGLLVFAFVLTVWDVSSVVRACMGAMNTIYELKETRSTRYRFALSIGLGLAIAILVIGAVLIVTAGPAANGALGGLLGFIRWVIAIVALGLAVGLLVHLAPVKRRAKRWVGLGTMLVIAAWIVMSILFKLFVTSLANFKTAAGSLTVFLVLTTYVYFSAIVFLLGVELDELLRKDATRGELGIIDRLRGVTG